MKKYLTAELKYSLTVAVGMNQNCNQKGAEPKK